MNHYYANGSHIFEGPPIKSYKPPYGSVGHLTSHLDEYQIKVEYEINPDRRADIDMTLTAPDGDILFVDAREHNNMRADIYRWVSKHGIKTL